MTRDELIAKMEQTLSTMTKNKRVKDKILLNEVPDEMMSFAVVFNEFINDVDECRDFIESIITGDLDADPPCRTNYLASPLKELHSQLISMSVNIKDLYSGKMVSKLYYPGELFENYNKLITLVTNLMKGNDQTDSQNVSSWTYHQVLAAVNQLTTMVLQYNDEGMLVFANVTAKNALNEIEQLPETDKPLKNDLLSYLGKFTNIIKRIKPHEFFGTRFPVKAELMDKKTDRWYSIHTDIAKLTDGKLGVIHMIDDISEWKYNEQELKNEASLDPMTSAFTRKIGEKIFQEMIAARKTSDNCVGFADLDGLKHINDNYGHTEGDFALKTVATVLMSAVRDTDRVIRYGGDEFLILFKDCTEDAAENIIYRMYEQLDDINQSIDKPYEIQFSTGLAHINENMDDMQDIIDIIDSKMYNNKLSRKEKRK